MRYKFVWTPFVGEILSIVQLIECSYFLEKLVKYGLTVLE